MSNEKAHIPTTAILEVSLGEKSESTLAKKAEENDGLPLLTMEEVEAGYITPKAAKARLGIAHLVYIRRLVGKGDLEGIKVKVPGGSRWLLTRESVEAYKAKQRRRGSKRNYVLRIDPKQESALRQLMDEADIPYDLKLAYEPPEQEAVEGESVWARLIAKID